MSISLFKSRGLGLAVLSVVGLTVGVSSSAKAAVILYSTDFNSTSGYTDGGLIGQDGWVNHSAAGTNPQTVANTATNGTVTLKTSGEDNHRSWVAPVASGIIYLSADITVGSAQATGDYFIHLGDGSATIFNDRVFAKSSGAGFVMAVSTGATTTPTYGSTVLTFGTTYHIVAEYDLVNGAANDTAALYVNPTDPIVGGDNLYVAGTTAGIDAASFLAVYLRQGAAASAAGVTVDNIVVATVPEPMSLSLLGLGGAGLLIRRRR